MSSKKPSKSLQQAALKAQQDATRSAQEAAIAQRNMQANFAANLAQDNVGTVVAGGTADVAALDTTDTARRRRQASGLSSTLGITA